MKATLINLLISSLNSHFNATFLCFMSLRAFPSIQSSLGDIIVQTHIHSCSPPLCSVASLSLWILFQKNCSDCYQFKINRKWLLSPGSAMDHRILEFNAFYNWTSLARRQSFRHKLLLLKANIRQPFHCTSWEDIALRTSSWNKIAANSMASIT